MPRYLLLFCGFLLVACNTTPQRRVHSAASIPRIVDIAPANFSEQEPFAIGGETGTAWGNSYSDTGSVYGSLFQTAGVSFHLKGLRGGFLPYFASAKVSHEGTHGFGALYWLAYHFGGGQKWRFSVQSSVAYMSKVAEEKGCDRDPAFFVGTVCTKSPESRTRAEVRATEVGITLTTERRVAENGYLLLAPAAYWTKVDTGNQLDFEPSGNYDRHLRAWNPGVQLGYIMRFPGERMQMALAFLAGAQWAKYFSASTAKRALFPSADLRFLF